MSADISAGKKNSDNTFSGVMIGDWSGPGLDTETSIAGQTGIYGFNSGAMSYALKEDGTAFFGKDGKGRINIDGNKATIYSASYNQNKSKGIKIDLDDAYIIIKDGSTNDNSVLEGQQCKIYPLQISNKFKVAWDGTIYAKDGNFEGVITGSTLKATASTSNNDTLDSSGNLANAILLDGQLMVVEKTTTEDEEQTIKNRGYLGRLDSKIPGAVDNTFGIGLSLCGGNKSDIVSAVKATASNAGMSYGNNSIFVKDDEIQLSMYGEYGNTSGEDYRQLVINDQSILMKFNVNSQKSWYFGIEHLENETDGIQLVCNIAAEQQKGIYARFA